MNSSKVSVLIPTYNSQSFIERALLSVLGQTYQNLEIVITDNASEDDTWNTVQRYASQDNRIKCLRHSKNLGPLANWQAGLAECTGTYIRVLWSDDWLDQHAIEESVGILDQDADTGLVFNAAIIHAEDQEWPAYLHKTRSRFTVEGYLMATILMHDMPMSPACALVRQKDASFDILPGSDERLRTAATQWGAGPDVLFMLNATKNYKYVAHIRKFYSHLQFRHDSFTGDRTTEVASVHCDTLKLFLEIVAAPKFPALARKLFFVKLIAPLINRIECVARGLHERLCVSGVPWRR